MPLALGAGLLDRMSFRSKQITLCAVPRANGQCSRQEGAPDSHSERRFAITIVIVAADASAVVLSRTHAHRSVHDYDPHSHTQAVARRQPVCSQMKTASRC